MNVDRTLGCGFMLANRPAGRTQRLYIEVSSKRRESCCSSDTDMMCDDFNRV